MSFKSTHGYRKGTLADILYYGRGPVELIYSNRYKPNISSIQMESYQQVYDINSSNSYFNTVLNTINYQRAVKTTD